MPKPKPMPVTLFMVHCRLGFPDHGDYEKAERKDEHWRVFKRADSAGYFIGSLLKWPKLHDFLGAYRARVDWQEIRPDQLPHGSIAAAATDEDQGV